MNTINNTNKLLVSKLIVWLDTWKINADINDNLFDDNINYEIVKDGEIINITGNQAP